LQKEIGEIREAEIAAERWENEGGRAEKNRADLDPGYRFSLTK
jgi:hypothetical protein